MENKEHNLQDKRCECCGYMTYQREHMSCIRAAKQTQQAVPEGYALVPAEPTPQMIEAAEGVEDLYRRGTPDTWGSVYRAMLAAAQK